MNRSRLLATLTAVLVSLWGAQAIAAPPMDERRLDDVGNNICHDSSVLKRAVAGAQDMRREAARVQQQLGIGNEAEQRRAFLQNELTQRLVGAQDQIVADTRRSLLANQAEYRRVASREFDESLCNGGSLRVSYMARVQQQKEQEWQSNVDMTKKALADGEAYRQGQIACEDWKVLQMPADQVERFRPGYQAEARTRFSTFSSDYQRKNGRPFDTKACR